MLRSSYRLDEVSFLLTDLSGHALELDTRERERAIQRGRNYAEMLPIEYAPSAEYLALFDALTEQFAAQIAEHVGVVTQMALAARGGRRPVLVSLARAGTPVGILMRRWALFAMNVDLAHYSISIVRGRGIDTVALDHIVARHDARDVLFVDGWTGKGAITTELAEALDGYQAAGGPRLAAELAVIADPGHCAALFGTREDVLVPSACLNSTVCGLVSRTVLNDLIGPGMFHGAKVYSELAHADRSARFLDAISEQFPVVAPAVAERWPRGYAADRPLTFAGRLVVERIQAEFGLPSQHLVKPGAGEATRVLLRRLPWLVLVRPDRRDMLEHLLLLAKERGVDVVDYPDMPYSCVGLVRPAAGPGAGA
jgi:Phosphoribosyl transferase (PRTase)/PELOTA RNA binding domain